MLVGNACVACTASQVFDLVSRKCLTAAASGSMGSFPASTFCQADPNQLFVYSLTFETSVSIGGTTYTNSWIIHQHSLLFSGLNPFVATYDASATYTTTKQQTYCTNMQNYISSVVMPMFPSATNFVVSISATPDKSTYTIINPSVIPEGNSLLYRQAVVYCDHRGYFYHSK